MACWKKCFEKLSELLTSKRFIIAWSVFYVTYLCLKFIKGFKEEAFANSGGFADFFINYSGGFVRRGLLGQVYLWLHQVGVSPIWAAVTLALVAFLVIATYMITQFRKRDYSLCLLTVGWFLGDFGLYGLASMRRDYIIMCFFLLIVWLWNRMGTIKWMISANVLACIGILCYEPFALFVTPFCILLTRLRLRNWCKSFVGWVLPVMTFLASCKYAGGKDVYHAIVASTADFLPSPGIMEFLQIGSVDVMKFHVYSNFLQIHHGIPVVLISFMGLFAMFYYSVNAIPVFTQNKRDLENRRYILAFLSCAFIVLLPMFTCLSTDYSRTCIYVCLSSYILFFHLNDEERAGLLPPFVYSWSDKLLAFSDKYLRPTRFKIVFIMLFIGVAFWTGSGIGGFINGSEVGNVAYMVLRILRKYAYIFIG